MVTKIPYAAVPRGIFQPTTSSEDIDEIQTWLGEQHTLFLSLNRIHEEALREQRQSKSTWAIEENIILNGISASHIQYYTRLLTLVIQSNRELLDRITSREAPSASNSRSPSPPSSRFTSHISGTLLPILTLAQTLYASPNAVDLLGGQGIVGEELLHWLNSYDLAPTTEQGREIASSSEPYLHPTYWDYILRCTLRGFHSTVSTLLSTLLTLPSSALVKLIERIRGLVQVLPRSINFKTEEQFQSARREFHLNLMTVLAGLEGVMDKVQDELEEPSESEEEAEDLRLSLEAGLRVFLEVLVGKKERVIEAAEDWKEALAAWATLVDVGLQREGLKDALVKVKALRSSALGEGNEVESKQECIMIQLIKGELIEACEASADVDPYLAQILADFLTKLGLLGAESSAGKTEATSQITIAQKANLVYANTLLSTFGLWRMAMDYFAHAGVRGRARMTQVVLGVPLLEDRKQAADVDVQRMEDAEYDEQTAQTVQQNSEFQMVESVLDACNAFGLSREAKVVCRKISLHLSSTLKTPTPADARYGPAIVYALRSPPRGDLTVLRLIKKRMLDDLLARRVRQAGNSSSDNVVADRAVNWFVEQVRDIKRWLITAQRAAEHREREAEEAGRDNEEPQQQAGPFLSSRRRFGGPGADDEEEALLLDDEEEWIAQFGNLVPAPVLLLTSLAHYFRLKTREQSESKSQDFGSISASAFMVDLLNSGLLDGDWTAIGLYEVGTGLPSPISSSQELSSRTRSLLDDSMLYDVLRILESLLFNASLSSSEANYALGKLVEWISLGQDANADSASVFSFQSARCELDLLRFKVAAAIGISALGPKDPVFVVTTPGGVQHADGGGDTLWEEELLEAESANDNEGQGKGDVAMGDES